jgi:uncharacterized protein (DUF2267 family)
MEHDAFIGHVQQRAHLPSRGDAERATRATLETVARRLEGGLAENIAAQLPPEIGRHLTVMEPYAKLSLDEFFVEVSIREGVDLPLAVHHARAVIETLDEALTGGGIAKMREQLPPEFAPLFYGSQGEMRA